MGKIAGSENFRQFNDERFLGGDVVWSEVEKGRMFQRHLEKSFGRYVEGFGGSGGVRGYGFGFLKKQAGRIKGRIDIGLFVDADKSRTAFDVAVNGFWFLNKKGSVEF